MKIGDITADIFSGGTPDTQRPEYWGGSLPWLSSGETRNRLITTTEKTLTELGVAESSTRKALKGDIVIASAGQGATRGRVSWCMIDTYINQSLISIRCDLNQVEPIWLFYNLYNRYDELRRLSDANSSRGSITTKLIRNLEVELPSLPEQQAVTRILEIVEQKIVSNERITKILRELGNSVFHSVFTEKLIVGAKMKALERNLDPEIGALQALTGREVPELPSEVANAVSKLVKPFASKVDTGGHPNGWR